LSTLQSQPPPHPSYPTAGQRPGPAASVSLPGRLIRLMKSPRPGYSKAHWHASHATGEFIFHEGQYYDEFLMYRSWKILNR
jgi:hypothetical protein